MKTREDFIELFNKCTFALFPSWEWNVKNDDERLYLQISGEDAKEGAWSGRKWFLSSHMTDSEAVQTLFTAVMAAVEHEVRENFRYRRRAVYGPHFDVNHLWELCGSEDAFDLRPNGGSMNPR